MLILISCSDDTTPGTDPDPVADTVVAASPGVKITATLTTSISRINPVIRPNTGETQVTPSVYKLALVNFWLLKNDATEVNIINPDNTNLTYTESRPLIIDFAAVGSSRELINTNSLTAGTYTGWKAQFLYMEMNLNCAFHVPSAAWETEYANSNAVIHTVLARNFRLYFNAIGKYWKRDFVTELTPNSGQWYWMRRGIRDLTGYRNFFISVANNNHPIGGAGPDSTIDLFDDPTFWGAASSYNSNASAIIVGTHSTAGGVSATLNQSFTIPAVLDKFYNIDIQINIANTMWYGETTNTAPSGVTFTSRVLDLGPSYDNGTSPAPIYGDNGLHPMVPQFVVTVTSGANDNKTIATKAFQVPTDCMNSNWTEPAACTTNYCPTHATAEFCLLVNNNY